ncbi:MAG: ATP-binding cassette domain-containing protein [Planctomycetota bacterium]|nr:ATP-binding cassette domain-containing protein [Planctomycetota bacterium]
MEISVNDLSFVYSNPESNCVFKSTTAIFSSGLISAVVGKSGSGKSTLLKLLAGLAGQDSSDNQCIFYGTDRLSPSEMAKQGRLSLCFQKPACLPWATVYYNIALPFQLQGKAIEATTIIALLDQFGLSDYRDSYPYQLSVGMQARVALARAFVTAPDVVLLDEPFSSLDVSWKEQLYTFLLRAQSQSTCTVVLVTHDLLEALCLADAIYVIEPRTKSVQPIVLNNPLKQTTSLFSFNDLIANTDFPNLFRRLHESIGI